MLKFPDGTQVGINGLDETLASLHSEGRPASQQATEEILTRLESFNNYIPSSYSVRREYAYVLLKEYREYVDRMKGNG